MNCKTMRCRSLKAISPICKSSNSTSGDKSKAPVVGMMRRIGATKGNTILWSKSNIGVEVLNHESKA